MRRRCTCHSIRCLRGMQAWSTCRPRLLEWTPLQGSGATPAQGPRRRLSSRHNTCCPACPIPSTASGHHTLSWGSRLPTSSLLPIPSRPTSRLEDAHPNVTCDPMYLPQMSVD